MGNSNASRMVFEKLDKDHNGIINLEDLTELPNLCSLTTLYHFDFNKQGVLNFKEFVEMDKFVQKIQKKIEKDQKLKAGETYKLYKTSDDDASIDNTTQTDQEGSQQSKTETSSNVSTTSTTTNGSAEHPHHPQITSLFSSPMRETTFKRVPSAQEIEHELKKQIHIALLPSLHKELLDKERRKLFLDWLFKLSDVHKTNNISKDELSILLNAVKNDEIDLETLVFDETEEEKKNDVVQRILSQYGSSNSDVLSKSEFLKLADMILSKYEARHVENTEEMVGDWRLLHTLGEGGYGKVKLVLHHKTGVKRAIKIIKEGNVSDMSKLDVEIQAMRMLKHPNVVQLYEIIEHGDQIYLVMELCGGGSLYEYLKDQPFEEELARYYFNQLIDGLSYCHENGICHRDLRLENLLLDNNGNLKITDFGQARIFKKGWDFHSTQLVGSLYHLSPEQIEGKVYSGEKVDIWNAGIILYCFVTARLPFCSADVMEMFEDIKKVNYDYPEEIEVSDEVKDLIAGMLQSDPNNRISLKSIKQHPWTTGPQKKPQLCFHQTTLTVKHEKAIDINILEHEIEKIFAEQNLHIIKVVYPETPSEVNNVSLASPTVSNVDETKFIYKCIQPAKDIKLFAFVSFLVSYQKICFEFQLSSGESKDFHDVITDLEKKLVKHLGAKIR